MANSTNPTRFRFWLWLIQLFGVIVPRRLRADWRQEWEAELSYREMLLTEWHLLDWYSKVDLLRRSLGAFWDALALQPQRLEDDMFQDLRFGVRMLLKKPGFALAIIITIALSIGANTAIFSIVNAVLLRQLPYQNPERLVVLWERQQDIEQESPSYPNFLDWQEQSRSFEQMAIARRDSVNLTGVSEPERLICRQVSANFFATLGVTPKLGRTFLPEEDRAGVSPVILISHSLWQRRFGADMAILNQTITLNDRQCTIVGVLPADFQFYTPADVFIPINVAMPERLKQAREEHGGVVVVARLKPEVQAKQVADEMETIALTLEQQYPKTNTTNRVFLRSIREDQTGDVKSSLLLLLAAVGFVLLIACVNIANLLMARAASRQKEIAIRSALGASNGRVVRQLLTESLLLATLGGTLGILLAGWGKNLLAVGIANEMPWIKELPLDSNVLIFAIAASLFSGIAFGFFPALQAAKPNLTETLKEGNKGASGGRQPMRSSLVVAEVALALLLLVGAGLLLRSFVFLNRIDTGFEVKNLLTMTTLLSPTRYDNAAKTRGFYEGLQQRVEALPGVQTVAFSSSVPLGGASVTSVLLEGQAFNRYSEGYLAVNSSVSLDYFRVLGITLLKGRTFTSQDTPTSGGLVGVIDDNMARDLFSDKDPLGQLIYLDEGRLPVRIVGVVNHIHHLSYDADEQSKVKYQFYTCMAQIPDEFVAPVMSNVNLLVRTTQEPSTLVAAVRSQFFDVDIDQPVYNVRTMNQMITRTLTQRRFLMSLFVLFAAVAITLAVVGIYGLISYSVTQRTHEIGIRLALGATTGDVLRTVLSQGVKLVISGIAIGLIAAYALTHLMSKLLYSVSATDLTTFAVVPMILTGVALAACYLPARRAAKVDPMIALRYE